MMIKEAVAGASNMDLAEKYGLSANQVSLIINHSEEAVDAQKIADILFRHMLGDAVKAVEESVNQQLDITNRLKAAQMVLDRGVGKVTDRSETRNLNLDVNMTEEELVQRVEEKLEDIKKRSTGKPSDVE